VDKSLAHLTRGDIMAMVAYLRSVPAMATPDLPSPTLTTAPASHREGVAANIDARGKAIFAGACASCHGWTGVSALTLVATLTGARAINDPTATNVAQIILSGGQRQTGHALMPPFGQSYSNTEVAAVANYVTARFGAKPSAITAEEVAKLREPQ
jgi:mono/diheme cytochrome c family protein